MTVADVFPEQVFESDPEGDEDGKRKQQRDHPEKLFLPCEEQCVDVIKTVKGDKTGHRVNSDLVEDIDLLSPVNDNGEEGLVKHVDPESDMDQDFVLQFHFRSFSLNPRPLLPQGAGVQGMRVITSNKVTTPAHEKQLIRSLICQRVSLYAHKAEITD